ncbi:MAG: hypothetical protein KatS3mg061_3560 [Dehalococcoidia bacterium]|nr:MAG: hypothetical protein KatS3mg061_3560 [Dehalococcoidia bacterium]
MSVIITLDIERAARRFDKTLRVRPDDVVGPQARELAEKLGVRLIREGEPEPPAAAPPTGYGAGVVPDPVRNLGQPQPPSPEVRAGSGAGGEPAVRFVPTATSGPERPANPMERYGAGVVTDPVREIGRPAPAVPEVEVPAVPRVPPVAPAAPEQYGAGVVPDPVRNLGQSAPPPAATISPAFSPEQYGAGVVLDPVRNLGQPEPAPLASPGESGGAARPPRPAPTLFSRTRPLTWRERRQLRRGSAPGSRFGVILGRTVDSYEVRRAAEQGFRFVRITPEAYVTRAAQHVAAQLGVVLSPDPELLEASDRTQAGTVINPISREPAITRRGAGVVPPGGIPVGGDHLPGTLTSRDPDR